MSLRTNIHPTCSLAALTAASVGLLGTMAGCATSPETGPAPEIDQPAAWSSASESGQPTAWLQDFDAPELAALVAEALDHNPDLAATAARFDQSIAEAQIAGADLMPSAGLGLNGARQQITNFGPTSTNGVIFENYDLSLNVSWELDLWGRLRDRSSAALARVEGNLAELYGAELSLASQTTKAWFNLIEAKQQLEFAESTALAYRKDQKALEDRFKRGLGSGLELRRIRTQTASAEADVTIRQRGLDEATRSFEIILGRYPGGELQAANELPPLPKPIPAGLPADLLRRRPDLVAAERKLAAADKELTAAEKDLLPQISLTASAGSSTQAFDDLLDGDFAVWSIAGNLTQPIFQGGRLRAAVDRSASLRDQAIANYRNTALRAFLEVETTLAAETYLKTEYSSLQIAADEASAAAALARKQYSSGIGNFTGTLDAIRTANIAQSRLIGARNLLLQNRADLYLALGGPF